MDPTASPAVVTTSSVSTGPPDHDRTITLAVAGVLGLCTAGMVFIGVSALWWPTQDWNLVAAVEKGLETLGITLAGGLLGMAQRSQRS